jgi:hypothetical protein
MTLFVSGYGRLNMATLQELQNLINNTPLNGLCIFPGGVVDCPDFTGLTITKSIRIMGNNTIFNLPITGYPTRSFITADTLPNGSYLEIRDITINGPDTTGWLSTYDGTTHSGISYQLYKTWDSIAIFDNIKITGGYSYGISRSGGGKFRITNSDLSGWTGGIAFFEGHGGWGDLLLRDTNLRAPLNSKYSSIGIYIHPHLHLTAERVKGYDWNRWVIYLNGSPQSYGHHDLIEVEAISCSLIQTGSGSDTTLVRCKESGEPTAGGSYFKGDVVCIDCVWEGSQGIGYLRDFDAKRLFVRNKMSNNSFWSATSAGVIGTIEAVECEFDLSKNGSRFKTTSLSNPVCRFISCNFTGANTSGFAVNMEGGSLELTKTTLPSNCRALSPGVII